MDFRQLMEGECGQSNPLVGLASHVTRNSAYELVNEYVEESSTFPQTFRTDDLLQQILNVEKETNVPPENLWVDECKNQFYPGNASGSVTSTQNANWTIINEAQHENNAYFDYYSYVPTPCEVGRLCGSERFASSLLHNEGYSVNNFRSLEEYEELQIEIEESQNEFLELDNNLEQLEESNIETEESIEEDNYIYFDGLGTKDILKAETPDFERSESENFIRFFLNYVKKFEDRDFDLHIEKEYTYQKLNPYIPKVTCGLFEGKVLYSKQNYAEAVLYFEAAVQVYPNCTKAWKYLVDSLKGNGQYYDAFCLAKKVLDLNPNYFSRTMYYFLFDEQYYYQGCQVILNWLRNHPDYHDIVPPCYTMEDKSTTLVEKKDLAELKKILIRAAQRCPIKPDYDVQVALSKVLEISRDYEKSGDCIFALVNSYPHLYGSWIDIGFHLLQNNEPHIALEVTKHLKSLTFANSQYSKCDEFSGAVNLYLKDYRTAGQYFISALTKLYDLADWESFDRHKITLLWTQLHLCAELMRREDLLELVKEKNWRKLRDEFNLQQ